MTVPIVDPGVQVGSPRWWTARLYSELTSRRKSIDLHRRYVDGDHNDPTVEQRASRAFKRILGLSKTNLTGLIVEATAERLSVQGFRFGDDPNADADAWAMWQASDFDAESELAITSALTVGRSFVMVEPPGPGDTWARLYAEDASQVVVAYAPGRRQERLAALKAWRDDWTGDTFATLFLPDAVYKLRSPGPLAQFPRWVLRDDAVASEPNPLGTVPIFELRNRPSLLGDVRSEVADVLSDQDRANHIALNALIAAEYGAFRQKWATGLEVPRDENGKPVEPFDVAVNRILIAEPNESGQEARFGDFNATDLKPYIELYESTVKHMAAVSRTPVAMLLGGMVNLSAEALALSVSGLVQKVRRRQKHFEQAFEQAMRLAFAAVGDPRAVMTSAETIWVDPEVRSRAQDVDAAVKLLQVNAVPVEQVWEDLGYSETQKQRMESWRAEGDSLAGLTSLLDQQAAGLTAGDVAPVAGQ